MNLRVLPFYYGKLGIGVEAFESWSLVSKLSESGVSFVSDPAAADEVWLFDSTLLTFLRCLTFPKKKRRLFVFEPTAVNPLQHRLFFQNRFHKTYVFSRGQAKKSNIYVEGGGFCPEKLLKTVGPLAEIKFDIAIAAGNKFSLIKGSQYHLRRKIINALVENRVSVTLAGPGWPSNPIFFIKAVVSSFLRTVISINFPRIGNLFTRLPHFKRSSPFFVFNGRVPDEVDFYRSAKLILVVENDKQALSEKAFNGVCARRKVVYVGPTEVLEYIDSRYLVHAPSDVETIISIIIEQLSADFNPGSVMDLYSRIRGRSEEAFYDRVIAAIGMQF